MNVYRMVAGCSMTMAILAQTGCAVSKVDFSTMHRPGRPMQLDAYDVFVGSWTWEAEMLNGEGPDQAWRGTAQWEWTLDQRSLQGTMSAQSGDARFETIGFWSWHPKKRKYTWWMFNNWGYPQEGTARYNADARCWRMDYAGVGLDGTTSYGRYRMTVVDDDTLDWSVVEWATPLHLVKKMEMNGTYRRKR